MITWDEIRKRARGPQVIMPLAVRRVCHQRTCRVKPPRFSMCRIEDAEGTVVWDGPLLTFEHNGTRIVLPGPTDDLSDADTDVVWQVMLTDLEKTIADLHRRDALLDSDYPAF